MTFKAFSTKNRKKNERNEKKGKFFYTKESQGSFTTNDGNVNEVMQIIFTMLKKIHRTTLEYLMKDIIAAVE